MSQLSQQVQIEEKAAIWKRSASKLKEAEESERIARDDLIEACGNENYEGNGIKVERIERKGAVEYKAIPELADINLEDYRKPSSIYWLIKPSVKE